MDFTGERFVSTLVDPEICYEHWHRYLYAGRFVAGKVVLDIACGEGYGSSLLSGSGATRVTGVDIDPAAVDHALKTYPADNLQFITGSVAAIPVASGTIDVLISFETIEHVDAGRQALFLREIKRVLKPNGLLIISTPDKHTYSDLPGYENHFHVKEFYIDEFKTFLEDAFSHVSLMGQKIESASYISPIDPGNGQFVEYQIQKTDSGYKVVNDMAKEMIYAIAMCSDAPLDSGYPSLLIDREDAIIKLKNQAVMERDKVIAFKEQTLARKDEIIEFKDRALDQKETIIAGKDREIAVKDREIEAKNQEVEAKDRQMEAIHAYLQNSLCHIQKLEQMIQNRSIRYQIKKRLPSNFFSFLQFYLGQIRRVLDNPGLIRIAWQRIKKQGLKASIHVGEPTGISPYFHLVPNSDYRYNALAMCPKISVVMPVYNVETQWLGRAIDSVLNQIYDNWELVIVDDGSTNHETLDLLKQLDNEKIIVEFNEKNQGISTTSNRGVALAGGDYIALLDNDDELREDALYEMVRAINDHDPDVLYSDEAKIDAGGNTKLPFLKPDWSPDLLRSQMYVGHLMVFKKKLFDQTGGFDEAAGSSQDYDLMLRFSEATSNIHHVPEMLYFWRELDSSTSINPASKPEAQEIGRKALDNHLKRIYGKEAHARETDHLLVYDSRYPLPENTVVSIIIPTRDRRELLEPCVNSIFEKTVHKNYEIIIMNNNSRDPETLEWLEKIVRLHDRVRVVDAPYEFNWSKINNHGVCHARGEILVFLNNDTTVISSEWLTRLAEKAMRSDVGTVGGLLLYDDDTVQHAGVVVDMGGWADHVFKGCCPIHYGSPYISPLVTRNVSSVTGACLAISRNSFDGLGGFNEQFIICGSDIDLSLRALKKGYVNVYDPHVNLYHYESKSRTDYIPEIDFKMSRESYREMQEKGDPYYNPNLCLDNVVPAVNCCCAGENRRFIVKPGKK